MKTQLSPELSQAIKTIANIIRPLLEEIHNLPASTQNYYADYMNILSGTNDSNKRKLFALAMIEAGANVYGIESAMKLIEGN